MADTIDLKSYQPPQVGPAQIRLLERLCNACAVSGDEQEVRQIVLEEIRPYTQEVRIDSLGNVLAIREGSEKRRLRVMLAAHMDEVGLMLTHSEEDSFFRFETVGGVNIQALPGKLVWVGRSHVPGVIGVKPVHLVSPEESKNAISLEALRIDLGPGNGAKANVGDRAAFATSFKRVGASLRAKALDDRLGVANLIELVKNPPANIDLLAAFTVQEEVGTRGASVASYSLDPDLAIVLECTPANDLPSWDGSENHQYNTRLGAGPAIYVADKNTLSDPRLVRHLVDTAEALHIPYQMRQPGSGGTDAGPIHRQRSGIPSISVSVPGRYLHTTTSLCRLSDWQHTLTLIHTALTRLTPEVLAPER